VPTADELLGDAVVAELLDALQAAERGNPFRHLRIAVPGLKDQALGRRAAVLGDALLQDLDRDHVRLARVVRSAYADGLAGWHVWPVSLAVATSGASQQEFFDDAMDLLAELTPRLTSEFAVRLLLRADAHRALAHAARWSRHEDEHVRRLASEGTRPKLPWGLGVPELTRDPSLTRNLLDTLHDDPSEYVRRSVANHLNDHSRAHPEFVVDLARGWLGSVHGERTVRHALRSLVKKGHLGALELLGAGAVEVLVSPFELSATTVRIGDSLTYRVTVENLGPGPADLVVDYVLFFADAGGRERSKVFKLARVTVEPGHVRSFSGTHSFRQLTTRTHFPGTAGFALQVNGVRHERADLTLLA